MVSSNGTAATCIMPMAVTSNGVWQGDNPIRFSLPLLIVQITLVIVVTRGARLACEALPSATSRCGDYRKFIPSTLL